MSFAVVWFKDGAFLDGRTVDNPGAVKAEHPEGASLYILPGETTKMRREQPMGAVVDCMRALREARRYGF